MIDLIQTWCINTGAMWLSAIAIGSTVILVFACLGSWASQKQSAARRFSIWQSAFVGLLLLPIGLAALPKLPMPKLPAQLGMEFERLIVRDDQSIGSNNVDEVHTPNPRGANVDAPTSSIGIGQRSSETVLTHSTARNSSEATLRTDNSGSPPTRSLLPFRFPWQAVLSGIWLVGLLWMLARIIRSSIWVLRMKNRSCCVLTASVMPSVIDSLDVDPVPIAVSKDVSIPITLGVFQPCVLLPESANDWTAQRLRMVLKHEMAHVKRHDVFWQLLAAIAKSIFWFHPLAWYAERRMQLERERACDDLVIKQDEDACDYAATLLGMSAELSGKNCKLIGALSMAHKPIEQRLITILEPMTQRTASSHSYRLMVGIVFSTILVTVCVFQPFGQSTSAATTSDEPAKSSSVLATPFPSVPYRDSIEDDPATSKASVLPDELKGKVVDHQGNPVSNARVEFTLDVSKRGSSDRLERIKLPHGKTNEAGVYTLPTKGITVPHGSYLIQGEVFAERFSRLRYGYRISKPETVTLPIAKFVKAKKISGRVVGIRNPIDGKIVIPINARVKGGNDAMQQFWRKTVACSEDGTFEIYAPAVGITDLIIESDNYAPTRFPVAQSKNELGNISLETGVEVFGKVVRADGVPAAGVQLNLFKLERIKRSTWSSRHPSLSIETSVATDEQGCFRFPRHNGTCMIKVNHRHREAKESWPILQPKEIDLSKSNGPVEVNLSEGKTLVLRGAVRWEDGSPEEGVEVSINTKLGNAFSGRRKGLTDKFGCYELRFPVGVEEVSVSSPGAMAIDGNWHYAFDKKVPIADAHRSVSMRFTGCDEDIAGADWELRAEANKSRVYPPRSAADFAFDELDRKFGDSWKAAWANARKADKSDPYVIQVANEEKFVDDLMKFEEKFRGEFAALVALYRVISWSSDSRPNASTESKQAWQIVLKHYIDHKDIDLLIGSSFQNFNNPVYQEFVEHVKRKNTHKHVQAHLLFQECELHRSAVAHFYRYSNSTQEFSNKKWIDFVEAMDLETSRTKVRELASEIISKYPDTEASSFRSEANHGYLSLWFKRSYAFEKEISTFAAKARKILFQVEKLAPGKPAPEILGKDVDGQSFKLSDLKGKVVLLTFSANWGNPKEANKALRELKLKNKDRSFEIVSVMMDRKLSDARKTVDGGEVTWQTVWDGDDRAIATQWSERSLPATYFLIDHHGLIRFLSSHRGPYPAQVDQLLSEVPN
jgi:beta-lactamase regulating signal transducer with metallopeptidase domain/peroxiredoxin